jgi:hypothetical protein
MVHFGQAGNMASDEANWCAAHREELQTAERQAAAARASAARRSWDWERIAARNRVQNDPGVRGVVIAAKWCGLMDWRRETLARIEREHEYGARFGIVNSNGGYYNDGGATASELPHGLRMRRTRRPHGRHPEAGRPRTEAGKNLGSLFATPSSRLGTSRGSDTSSHVESLPPSGRGQGAICKGTTAPSVNASAPARIMNLALASDDHLASFVAGVARGIDLVHVWRRV